MTNKCDSCTHSKVCIYKKKYQEIYTTLGKEVKYDEPFSIELDCKEYKYNELISFPFSSKDLKINYASVNPCEGCNIYEEMKEGKLVLNDACSFCSKNPYKMEAKNVA